MNVPHEVDGVDLATRFAILTSLIVVCSWLILGCDSDDSVGDAPEVIISGQVLDNSGEPISEAHVHLIYLFDTSQLFGVSADAESKQNQLPVSKIYDDEYDLGDLGSPYPTSSVSGGGPAHRLTGIACLGSGVTGETDPWISEGDSLDDGVQLVDLFMEEPCPTAVLQIRISEGPNYVGQPLYLNMWIDGNDDGDFDDEDLCSGIESSEWWVQNREVTPIVLLDTLLMPAVNMTMQSQRAVRIRLSGETLDRDGFVGVDEIGGEVEDYWLGLEVETPVELVSFWGEAGNAHTRLYWRTASETNNHYFVIGRGVNPQGPYIRVGTVPGKATTSDTSDYSYVDCGVINGHVYYYQLTAVDYGGVNVSLEPVISMTPSEEYPGTPVAQVHPIYPNPGTEEIRIPFELDCSQYIRVVVEPVDYSFRDTLWSAIPPEQDFEVIWNGGHRPSGMYIARVLTSEDDLGEQYFFLNRDDPELLSSVEALYNTGESGAFQIIMDRAKHGMTYQGRDENGTPITVSMLDHVVVVATKAGYVTALDTVAVSPGVTSQVTLIMEPQ